MHGQQNTHDIILNFLYMVCVAINYRLVIRQNPFVFALKFDYLSIYSSYGENDHDSSAPLKK